MIEAIPLFGEAPLVGSDRLVAHFATRIGGSSAPPFDSLNLGFSTKDDPARVRENRHRLCVALDVPMSQLVVSGQVHGRAVHTVEPGDAGEGALSPSRRLRGRDAVLLREPGIFALALSADCPLVVIADPVRTTVGVAHAGWRGTAAGVIDALAATMRRSGCAPSDWTAAISPGIGGCCYPVGAEVVAALEALPGADEAVRKTAARGVSPIGGEHPPGGRWLDLRVIHRAVLIGAGVASERIHVESSCTACEGRRFFSHRREQGATGRSGAIVGWRD